MLIKYSSQSFTVLVPFSTDDSSETQESSAINDGRSILAMFLTVLYMVEGIDTKTLKFDLVQ